MRYVAAVLCVLFLAGVASADMTGCSVVCTMPTEVRPGEACSFCFRVQNGSPDGEGIASIRMSFPDGYALYPETMACDEIVPGRPCWNMFIPSIDHTAIWEDSDGGTGEILAGEGTTIYIDGIVGIISYGTPIFWCIQGDGAGAGFHEVCGCVHIAVSPVEEISWTTIKSLYR